MPTARELLEQVDSLMRRNRALEAAAVANEVPVLTEAVAGGEVLREAMAAPVEEIPVLTEIVAGVRSDAQSGAEPQAASDGGTPDGAAAGTIDGALLEAKDADETGAVDAAETGADGTGAVNAAETGADGTGAVEAAEKYADTVPADASWRALADEVQMQVLQRIDIFTDTGLREQLAARLKPVVERASAEFVATITRDIGQILRRHVDDAVEREVDRIRRDLP